MPEDDDESDGVSQRSNVALHGHIDRDRVPRFHKKTPGPRRAADQEVAVLAPDEQKAPVHRMMGPQSPARAGSSSRCADSSGAAWARWAVSHWGAPHGRAVGHSLWAGCLNRVHRSDTATTSWL